jgi:hypothetical protein
MTTRSIILTPSTVGLPRDWPRSAWRKALQEAADAWSYPAVACTSVQIKVADPAPRRIAEQDGTNLVVLRNMSWCHNERCDPGRTFPWRAMGMTTTYPPDAKAGAIVEADIELNAVAFRFSHEPLPPLGTGKHGVRLKAVLVHELGHLLGLEDACVDHYRPSGSPAVGDCPAEELHRAMFAPALLDRPAPPDMQQLCQLHPRSAGTSQVAGADHARRPEQDASHCACAAVGAQQAAPAASSAGIGHSQVALTIVVALLAAWRCATSTRSDCAPRSIQKRSRRRFWSTC